MKIKVFIADDHDIVREGIKAVIKRDNLLEVVGEGKNGLEVLAFARNNNADVYVVDLYMPEQDGLDTISKLIKLDSNAKVIVLSVYEDRNTVLKSFKSGCKGYVTKVKAAEEIIDAINKVNCGGYFISEEISDYIFEVYSNNFDESLFNETELLSMKEKEVLKFIAEGKSSKEISTFMGISFNTVNVHRNNIMHKLNLHKTAELVRYAIKERIVTI